MTSKESKHKYDDERRSGVHGDVEAMTAIQRLQQ
jgi:hypothetical protein